MFKRLMSILALAIITLLTPTAAYERPGAFKMGVWPVASRDRMDFEILQEIGVSPEKSEGLGKAESELRIEIRILTNQIRGSRERLKLLILKEEPNLNEIKQILEEQEGIRTQIILKGIMHELYIKKTLTKEEWDKFMKLRIERTRKWRNRPYEGM